MRSLAILFALPILWQSIPVIAANADPSPEPDSAVIRYNGPLTLNENNNHEPVINILSGYVGIVRCSNVDAACRLVREEPRKIPVPCDKPPFGDPPEASIPDGQENLANALKAHIPTLSLPQARAEMRNALSTACEAKYRDGSRAEFHAMGIDDHEFDTEMVFTLASRYIIMEIANSPKGRKEQAEINQRLSGNVAQKNNRPMVYAAFLCPFGNYCQAHGESYEVGHDIRAEAPFRSLSQCRSYIVSATSGGHVGPDGKIKFPDGTYWECRGKHVDDWEPAR